MQLSLNEIRKRAILFSKEWKNETRENAESKTFWDGFFDIFGISRRKIASFEEPVKKLNRKYGFIDLFWKGTLIVEHKSKGRDLEKAYSQALDYFSGLKESELPKYVLVSDFARLRLYDLESNVDYEFQLKDLHKHIHLFAFIRGNKKQSYLDESIVNIKAAELMGKLHDILLDNGYSGHELEVFLVRIMFCLFAEDTEIFDVKQFLNFIETETSEDGHDLGMHLSLLFQVLDTPENKRQCSASDRLKAFRYINGALFRDRLSIPTLNKGMRNMIIECCHYNWSEVSPIIFGSLFQSVMDKTKRSSLGAHYTSEKNVMKVINDLFLNDLVEEFENNKNSKRGLNELLAKILKIKIFDPACGCGNFLIISYR